MLLSTDADALFRTVKTYGIGMVTLSVVKISVERFTVTRMERGTRFQDLALQNTVRVNPLSASQPSLVACAQAQMGRDLAHGTLRTLGTLALMNLVALTTMRPSAQKVEESGIQCPTEAMGQVSGTVS